MATEEQDRSAIAQIWDTSTDLQEIYQRRGLQWLLQTLIEIHNAKRIWATMQALEQIVTVSVASPDALAAVLNDRRGQVDRGQMLDYVLNVAANDPDKLGAAVMLLLMNECTAYGKTAVAVAGSSQPQA